MPRTAESAAAAASCRRRSSISRRSASSACASDLLKFDHNVVFDPLFGQMVDYPPAPQ